MTIRTTPGAIKKFRRTAWRFQTTFQTPPPNQLETFVSTILPDEVEFENGSVTIAEIIFEPTTLKALLAGAFPESTFGRDSAISAEGKAEVRQLLQATLSDPVDFLFVPEPKPFVIYADHDEYATFYANTKSNLNPVIHGLREKGFAQVQHFERKF